MCNDMSETKLSTYSTKKKRAILYDPTCILPSNGHNTRALALKLGIQQAKMTGFRLVYNLYKHHH